MVLFGLLVLICFTEVDSICLQKCYYCAKMNGTKVGDLFVEDCSVFVNSTVNITCQLNDNIPDNASSLYFKRGDTRLDDGDIILVDERTAVLPYTMSMEDIRKNFYCYRKTNMLRPIGKVEFLYIEYYPQQVENFSCIWLGLAPNSLQCFWQHPVEYKYISKMEVSLEWKVGEKNPYEYSCPFVIDYVKCENITNIYRVDDVFFRINVTNTLMGVTTSSLIENRFPKTPRNLYGKPYMVENLTASEINRTIKLQWTAATIFTTFRIYYNSSSGEKMIESRATSITVSNLTTYTVYKFNVVRYYTDFFNKRLTVGLPSDPVSVTVRTWQDVAKYPPRITNGGFMVNTAGSVERRTITVYWQNFDDMDMNGPVIEFEVVLGCVNENHESHMVPANQSQFTFHGCANSIPVETVSIKAGTVIGTSQSSHPIIIAKETIRPPTVLLERYNDADNQFDMLISWQSSSGKEVKGYTVFWCEGSSVCQKQIEWQMIDRNLTKYRLEKLDSTKMYLYGVSMEIENASSGLFWESCSYKRDETPTRPKAVQIVKQKSTTVTMSWTRPVCDHLSPYVQKYKLYWCLMLDESMECVAGANGTTEINTSISDVYMEYTINNLKSGTRYAVWVQAISSAGKFSLPGEKNYNVSTVVSDDTEARNIKSIILVVVVVAVVISVIVFAAILDSRFHLRKVLFEKPVIDHITIQPSKRTDNTLVNDDNKGFYYNGIDNKALNISNEEISGKSQDLKLKNHTCSSTSDIRMENKDSSHHYIPMENQSATRPVTVHLPYDYFKIGGIFLGNEEILTSGYQISSGSLHIDPSWKHESSVVNSCSPVTSVHIKEDRFSSSNLKENIKINNKDRFAQGNIPSTNCLPSNENVYPRSFSSDYVLPAFEENNFSGHGTNFSQSNQNIVGASELLNYHSGSALCINKERDYDEREKSPFFDQSKLCDSKLSSDRISILDNSTGGPKCDSLSIEVNKDANDSQDIISKAIVKIENFSCPEANRNLCLELSRSSYRDDYVFDINDPWKSANSNGTNLLPSDSKPIIYSDQDADSTVQIKLKGEEETTQIQHEDKLDKLKVADDTTRVQHEDEVDKLKVADDTTRVQYEDEVNKLKVADDTTRVQHEDEVDKLKVADDTTCVKREDNVDKIKWADDRTRVQREGKVDKQNGPDDTTRVQSEDSVDKLKGEDARTRVQCEDKEDNNNCPVIQNNYGYTSLSDFQRLSFHKNVNEVNFLNQIEDNHFSNENSILDNRMQGITDVNDNIIS